MASISISTQETSFKSPPDFSFPPKYLNTTTIAKFIGSTPTHSQPEVGFPSNPEIPVPRSLSPRPIQLPEIMTPITPLSPTSKGPSLLTIPVEIRLQIYHYVLLNHPIDHAHLAPLLDPNSRKKEFHTSMFKPQGLSFPPTTPCSSITQIRSSPPQTRGKIPSALLITCRQIFTETQHLPFTSSHLAFVNWFRSGVYAARQFTRSLRPWQSEALRYVSVEVLGRDLWVGKMEGLGGGIGGGSTCGYGQSTAKGLGEWRELCALWSCVWGLRLVIKGSLFLDEKRGAGSGEVEESRSSDFVADAKRYQERGLLDVDLEWVMDGLLRMKGLRWIELEIQDEDVDRESKLAFCAELESVLSDLRNEGFGWMGDVKVVFVERVPEKKAEAVHGKEPRSEEDWFGQS